MAPKLREHGKTFGKILWHLLKLLRVGYVLKTSILAGYFGQLFLYNLSAFASPGYGQHMNTFWCLSQLLIYYSSTCSLTTYGDPRVVTVI